MYDISEERKVGPKIIWVMGQWKAHSHRGIPAVRLDRVDKVE
jgi:hypothetical protein